MLGPRFLLNFIKCEVGEASTVTREYVKLKPSKDGCYSVNYPHSCLIFSLRAMNLLLAKLFLKLSSLLNSTNSVSISAIYVAIQFVTTRCSYRLSVLAALHQQTHYNLNIK